MHAPLGYCGRQTLWTPRAQRNQTSQRPLCAVTRAGLVENAVPSANDGNIGLQNFRPLMD